MSKPAQKEYVYQEYPKWIYHPSLPARVVQSIEEQTAAGPEWKESPALFIETEIASEELVDQVLESVNEETKVKRKTKGAK